MSKSQEKPVTQTTEAEAPVNNTPPAQPEAQQPDPVPAPEAEAAAAPSGIPTAGEIRLMHKPAPEQPVEDWLTAARNQLGAYLRENAQLLADGTELEYVYKTEDPTNRVLWASHYIKLQWELQTAGYRVHMIGTSDNPHLRIRLGYSKQVVAETK